MSLLRCVVMLLFFFMFDSIALARKVKRKESYRHIGPPHHSGPGPSGHGGPSPPYQFEDIHHEQFPPHQPSGGHFEHDYVTGHGNSYLNDNGLRSIAKGSADQANSAVASQNAAGKQAAYVAKSTLAQAAAHAANTAVAVVKGKEVLLRRLEEQNAETHKVLENELHQLQQAKRSAKTAQYAAQQALSHVSVLTAALNNAQTAAELAQKSASEAAAELASQIDMVAQAKTKLELIETQLHTARLDFEETKEAAEKATQSAQEAQINANDAAVHANVELSDSAVYTTVHAHEKIDQNMRRRGTKRIIHNHKSLSFSA